MTSEGFPSVNDSDSMIEEPHGNYRCECDDFLQKHIANKHISGVMPSLEVCGGIRDYK